MNNVHKDARVRADCRHFVNKQTNKHDQGEAARRVTTWRVHAASLWQRVQQSQEFKHDNKNSRGFRY